MAAGGRRAPFISMHLSRAGAWLSSRFPRDLPGKRGGGMASRVWLSHLRLPSKQLPKKGAQDTARWAKPETGVEVGWGQMTQGGGNSGRVPGILLPLLQRRANCVSKFSFLPRRPGWRKVFSQSTTKELGGCSENAGMSEHL